MLIPFHQAALHRTAEYKPSSFYFRAALRTSRTKAEAIEIGLQSVREIENLKEQMRAAGLAPVPRFVLSTEADAKGLSSQSVPPAE